MEPKTKKFDLEERTFKFATGVIEICQKSKKDIITTPIINQLIRSGMSIGANYHEANGASSKKESKETLYWLNVISDHNSQSKLKFLSLIKENQEIIAIISKIIINSKKNK